MFRVELNDSNADKDEYEFSSAVYDFPWLLENKACASIVWLWVIRTDENFAREFEIQGLPFRSKHRVVFSQLKLHDPIFDNCRGGPPWSPSFFCVLKIGRLNGRAALRMWHQRQICNRQLAIGNAIVCAPFPRKDRPASALDFRLHCMSNKEVAMKRQLFIVALFSFFCAIAVVRGQSGSAAQTADQLKLQLLELQAQEEGLRARAVELDEAIKPENIQRSLAGVGSTRPEELREARRKQLESEKRIVEAQLNTLAVTKAKLESAIATAEAEAYHQSAAPPTTFQRFASSVPRVPLFLMIGSLGVVVLVGIGSFVFIRRQRRIT